MSTHKIYLGENYELLKSFPNELANLIYIDPPFNSDKTQKRRTPDAYQDRFCNPGLYHNFMQFRLVELYRLLKPEGSLFLHIDSREAHYLKIMLDDIFGSRNCFMNEIIWAYDYGARSKVRWSAKHDTIFWYVKDPNNYIFNYDEIDRIPYLAPDLVGEEKAECGKTPTDVWWHSIVGTNSKEKTGYPTQKPLGLLNRIVKIHSKPGDTLLDCFAGSGTLGEAAALHNRNSLLIDENIQAIRHIVHRLALFNTTFIGFDMEDIVAETGYH